MDELTKSGHYDFFGQDKFETTISTLHSHKKQLETFAGKIVIAGQKIKRNVSHVRGVRKLDIVEDGKKLIEETAKRGKELAELQITKHNMKDELKNMIENEKELINECPEEIDGLVKEVFNLKGTLIYGFEGKTGDAIVETTANYHSKVLDDSENVKECVDSCKLYSW